MDQGLHIPRVVRREQMPSTKCNSHKRAIATMPQVTTRSPQGSKLQRCDSPHVTGNAQIEAYLRGRIPVMASGSRSPITQGLGVPGAVRTVPMRGGQLPEAFRGINRIVRGGGTTGTGLGSQSSPLAESSGYSDRPETEVWLLDGLDGKH